MRWIWLGFALTVVAVVGVLGVHGSKSTHRPLYIFPDMQFQPRYNAQGQSDFFRDARTMRTPPAGTVAFGGGDFGSTAGQPLQNKDYLQADDAYYRGKDASDQWLKKSPVPLTLALLQRGRERFNIHCAVCHGATGSGNGITTQYGMVGVANFHLPELRAKPDGEIFNTITKGKGVMMPYGHLVKPPDRWAIVAYVRALQRSQNARLEDVPEQYRAEMDK